MFNGEDNIYNSDQNSNIFESSNIYEYLNIIDNNNIVVKPSSDIDLCKDINDTIIINNDENYKGIYNFIILYSYCWQQNNCQQITKNCDEEIPFLFLFEKNVTNFTLDDIFNTVTYSKQELEKYKQNYNYSLIDEELQKQYKEKIYNHIKQNNKKLKITSSIYSFCKNNEKNKVQNLKIQCLKNVDNPVIINFYFANLTKNDYKMVNIASFFLNKGLNKLLCTIPHVFLNNDAPNNNKILFNIDDSKNIIFAGLGLKQHILNLSSMISGPDLLMIYDKNFNDVFCNKFNEFLLNKEYNCLSKHYFGISFDNSDILNFKYNYNTCINLQQVYYLVNYLKLLINDRHNKIQDLNLKFKTLFKISIFPNYIDHMLKNNNNILDIEITQLNDIIFYMFLNQCLEKQSVDITSKSSLIPFLKDEILPKTIFDIAFSICYTDQIKSFKEFYKEKKEGNTKKTFNLKFKKYEENNKNISSTPSDVKIFDVEDIVNINLLENIEIYIIKWTLKNTPFDTLINKQKFCLLILIELKNKYQHAFINIKDICNHFLYSKIKFFNIFSHNNEIIDNKDKNLSFSNDEKLIYEKDSIDNINTLTFNLNNIFDICTLINTKISVLMHVNGEYKTEDKYTFNISHNIIFLEKILNDKENFKKNIEKLKLKELIINNSNINFNNLNEYKKKIIKLIEIFTITSSNGTYTIKK